SYTGSPNLNEHFRTALFVMSDRFGEELLSRARTSGTKQEERGLLLAGQYSNVVRNIAESLQMRLVEDLMNPLAAGASSSGALFYGALGGSRFGNFDVIVDPRAREQILAGQLSSRGLRTGFDVWASFESRSVRTGASKRVESPFEVSDFRIDA